MAVSDLPRFASIAEAVASVCGGVRIERSFRVPGGGINRSYGLGLSGGGVLFLKTNGKPCAGLFDAESAGLRAISRTGAAVTPALLALGTDDGWDGGCSFLLMEFVEGGKPGPSDWENLARDLAAMHRASAEGFIPPDGFRQGLRFGFLEDNYIGRTRQVNAPAATWTDFFRRNRLEFQFALAERYFDGADFRRIDALLSRLGDFLVEPERPSLLHGDLWGGNVLCGRDSRMVLIDPACYVGHAESDIAMTELFGGFGGRFHAAYRECGLLQPGYSERRDLYNLYHILNHLNMFGGGYLPAVKSILKKYVG